jgi:hypothetical protein
MAVNTKQVAGRRQIEYSSYQDILDDVHSLAARPTRQLGNWSLGEICKHLAKGMDMAVDGPPFKPSWLIRMVGPLIKKRFLSRPIKPGFKLPPNATAMLPEATDTGEGVAILERAIQRLQRAGNRKPHPVFGRMTDQEWDRFQFLHSAMHLSFIVPEAAAH